MMASSSPSLAPSCSTWRERAASCGREFVATDELTVADILMTHVLGGQTHPNLLKPFTHIRAYRARCTVRPAWQNERVEAA